VAPLGFDARRSRRLLGRCERLRRLLGPFGDRPLQAPAIAKRQPELLEVALAQIRQNIEVDRVVREGPGMMSQATALEPALE
jgi:hypothetical protein